MYYGIYNSKITYHIAESRVAICSSIIKINPILLNIILGFANCDPKYKIDNLEGIFSLQRCH